MKHPITDKRRRIFLYSIIAFFVIAVTAVCAVFFWYAKEMLHNESVTQLKELSNQLFERMDVQLNIQWDYLNKLQNDLEGKTSITEDEIKETFVHFQNELAPIGKKIKFRVIDSEGHYYTDSGRQGVWTGKDYLKDGDSQSFLITNWTDSENYMAFVHKANSNFTVDGQKITHFVLLRSMTDMQEFFHSSSFNNNNISYVINDNGAILYKSGKLDGIEFNGINIVSFLKKENVKFLHSSVDELLNKADTGETVCTDIKVSKSTFYVIYNKMPQFEWGIMLIISSNDVATSTALMVQSINTIFLAFLFFIIVITAVCIIIAVKMRQNRETLTIKEKSEKALNETNIKLQQAQKETEKALETAKQATKAKSQFLANMSHDIRTPMNAIVGVTKLMEHEVNNPEKLTYYIGKLRHSSQYMLGLINDVLDMSKIESGDVQLNLGPVKMAEQVGQIESIIRSQSNEKNQEFTVLVHEITHEYLIGDSIRLRQVFLNLLSNAVKYTQEGGKICFELTELACDKPGYATILTSVTDNGVGMSEEFQKKMFDPFARERNSTTNKVGGTGLGLSIAKNIVELMNGKITVKSEPMKGSRFDVLLTLAIDEEPHEIPAVRKMLLVSEEDMLIDNIKASLKDKQVELLIAQNTDVAQIILSENEVEAILLSGYLSKKELSNAVETLRKSAKNAMFIFCCDYAYKNKVRDMLVSSGVDGLITRPFFVENLILAIDYAKKDKSIDEINTHSSLSGKKFLCAEDNELNAEILQALLDLHGATCVIYKNGADLVKAFSDVKEGDFDAILMDMSMPVMDGIAATGEIRRGENPLGKTIPIIAMTANAFSSDAQACIDAGMNAHLAKPLDIKALERTLQEILINENKI